MVFVKSRGICQRRGLDGSFWPSVEDVACREGGSRFRPPIHKQLVHTDNHPLFGGLTTLYLCDNSSFVHLYHLIPLSPPSTNKIVKPLLISKLVPMRLSVWECYFITFLKIHASRLARCLALVKYKLRDSLSTRSCPLLNS